MKRTHAILGVFLGSLSFLSVSQNAQASFGDWKQYRYEHANDRDRYYDGDQRGHNHDRNRGYDRDWRGHNHDRNRDYDRDWRDRYQEGRNRRSHYFEW
jgi:hypothetical protein